MRNQTCSPEASVSLPLTLQQLPTATRMLDILCCLLALPFLCIAVLVMTVVTRLVSPGPVFFRQERIGLHGRRFQLFKFRTMRINADAVVHQNHFQQLIRSNAPMVKLDSLHDNRLIPGGWLLRASGLDELPQLINVLRGDMSLVGPRPCIANEYEQFLPWQRERVNALPGLTGLWQVSGKNRTTFEEMMRLDIHYSRNVSLWLNLKIIFLTPWAMLEQIIDTRRNRRSLVPHPGAIRHLHHQFMEPHGKATTGLSPSATITRQSIAV